MKEHSRLVGAFVLGFALVAGSYVLSNFGHSSAVAPETSRTGNEPLPRVAIKVTDNNNNGIEDWKESVTRAEPLLAPTTAQAYEEPTTLTGQFSVEFYKSFLTAKTAHEFGASNEELVQNAVDSLVKETQDKVYREKDMVVIEGSPTTLRAYSNQAANIFIKNNVSGVTEPTLALGRALDNNDPNEKSLNEIKLQAQMYATMRDQFLTTPVPEYFLPIHIAFVNACHALSIDLEAFSEVFDDPLKSLLRVKRYQDDVVALETAMTAMYVALDQSPVLFDSSEPLGVFLLFKPEEE